MGRPETGRWDTVFEACSAVCRTHSRSTVHENAYLYPRRFCFSGPLGRPHLDSPGSMNVAPSIKLVVGQAGKSCAAVCGAQQLACSSAGVDSRTADALSQCDLMREHFACEAGCSPAQAIGEAPYWPAYVAGKAEKANWPSIMPAYVRPIWNRDNPPLRLRADAVNHWLKLRHNFAPPKSNGQLRMEIGLDVDIKNAKARPLPWLAFLYTIKEGWLSPGALEVNPYWGTYNRSFQVGSVPVDAKVGACWDGTPHVEVGVGSVPIMIAAAVAMLAAGKPINVSRKEVGGWRLNLRMPRARSEYANATIQPAVEVDVGVQRIQRGLVLNLSQLSPVLRLRQD